MKELETVGRGLCLAGAGVGLAGLLAWIAGMPQLTAILPGRPVMMPLTCLLVLIAGAAGVIRNRVLADVAGILVLATAAAILMEYAAGVDLLVDRFLRLPPTAAPFPGRPSPPTALMLGLYAGSRLLSGTRRWHRHSEWLALGAGLTAFTALLGLLFGARALYRFPGSPPVVGVALPTTIALLFLASGALLLRPDTWVARLVASTAPGEILLRRLMLASVLAPSTLGWVIVRSLSPAGAEDYAVLGAVLCGSMTGLALVLLAITAVPFRRAEAVVDATRAQLRNLVEHASDGVFVADLAGRYTEVNEAGCRMLGFSREELLGKTILDLIPPSDEEKLRRTRDQLLAGTVSVDEWTLRRKDGTWLPVEVSTKILADGRWQAFVRDTTERKAMQTALRLSEARASGIVTVSADAIISIDENQQIAAFNDGAEKIFGWRKEEAIGRPLDMLIPERLRSLHRRHVDGFATGAGSARRTGNREPGIFGVRKNGEEFPADASISRFEVEGTPVLTVALRDMTEQVRLYRTAQEAIGARDELLGIVAHDLRNPLASILLQVRLLRHRRGDHDPELQSADVIERAATRMERLIQDLLDVTSMEAGHLPLQRAEVSVQALLAECLESQRSLAAAASIALRLEPGVDLPSLWADRDRIQQVLENLIGNALKFTPPSGEIVVGAEAAPGEVVFRVSDSGQGIPPDHLPHLFDRFWQASTFRRSGAGLGLAITKGIVEAHGGRIRVESTLGRGTCVYFTIPTGSRPALGTSHLGANLH